MHLTYSEKLQDPRWHLLRSRILERDKHKCRQCPSEERLQVHHRYYIAKREPWEYPDFCFLTLCDRCHTEEHVFPFEVWEAMAAPFFEGENAWPLLSAQMDEVKTETGLCAETIIIGIVRSIDDPLLREQIFEHGRRAMQQKAECAA